MTTRHVRGWMAFMRKRIKRNSVKIKPRKSKITADSNNPPRLRATLLKAAPWGMIGTVEFAGLSFRFQACRSKITPKKMRTRPQAKGRTAGPIDSQLPKGNVADQIEIVNPRAIQKRATIESVCLNRVILPASVSPEVRAARFPA
jgi:hypothetical protein